MNVNTTTRQQVTDAEIDRQMQKQAVDMKRIFAESPTMDIKLPTRENSKDQTVEGGTNGYFWKLQRGVIIRDVPLPILDSLDEAGIEYSRLSMLKPVAQKQTAESTKSGKRGGKKDEQDPSAE